MSIASSLARIGLAVLALAGCARSTESAPWLATGGDAERGRQVLRAAGCGSCHAIPGVRGARGTVGPPLVGFSRRIYIAGHVPNTPENLVRWISDPQALEPGTAMPDVELSERPARDAAAYLLSLD